MNSFDRGVACARANMLTASDYEGKNCSYSKAINFLNHYDEEFILGYKMECKKIDKLQKLERKNNEQKERTTTNRFYK